MRYALIAIIITLLAAIAGELIWPKRSMALKIIVSGLVLFSVLLFLASILVYFG